MPIPWKAATLTVVALGATIGTSTLTTAYLMRPPMPVDPPAAVEPAEPAPYRPAVVRVTPPSATRAEIAAAAPAASAASRTPASRPDDCDTGSDRALRTAKPGALVVAGLGTKHECGSVVGGAAR